jgi:hypothetical protein
MFFSESDPQRAVHTNLTYFNAKAKRNAINFWKETKTLNCDVAEQAFFVSHHEVKKWQLEQTYDKTFAKI